MLEDCILFYLNYLDMVKVFSNYFQIYFTLGISSHIISELFLVAKLFYSSKCPSVRQKGGNVIFSVPLNHT